MPRPSCAAAAKAVKYVDEAPSDEGEDEDAELMDASESASVGSSSRKGSLQKDQEDEEWSQGDDSDTAPARKKARTSTSSSASARKSTSKAMGKGRGKAGKLSAFLAMPLDILVEISRHLDPPSLLSMSRANKMMHGVFARRSAAPIWAIVRGNVDLPALKATDLSEMALASLVFERNCHLCGRGRASIVDYALRVRWCKKCQRANLDNQSRVRRKVEILHNKAFECSLFTLHSLSGYNSNKNPYYCTPDVERLSAHLFELEGKKPKKARKAKKKKGKKRKHEDEDDESDVEEDKMDEVDEGKLEAFVKERHDIVAASQKDAEALVNWERSSLIARKESGETAREARKEAIQQKLFALGYVAADCNFNPYTTVWNLVDQPTKLTNAIWTRISPKIIEYAESQKKRRVDRETANRCRIRHDAVRARYKVLLAAENGDAYLTFPAFSIFDSLPSVEPLWVPEGATSTDEQWAAALPAILDEVELARRAIKIGYARKLVTLLADAGAPVDAKLAEKLEPSKVEPVQPIGVLREAVDSVMSRYGTPKLDLTDMADEVSDVELDALFSRLIAVFLSGGFYEKKFHHFPAIHEALRDESRAADVSSALLPSVLFVKQVLDILKRTGLPDHPSSRTKLEALGPVFECHGCGPAAVMYSYFQRRAPRASHGSENLYWSEMMEHALLRHGNLYSEPYLVDDLQAKRPEIRLSTSTYPPAPSRTTAPTLTPGALARQTSTIPVDELEAWFDAAPVDEPSTVTDDEIEAWFEAKRLDVPSPLDDGDALEAWFEEEASVGEPSVMADDDLEAWYDATGLDESTMVADDERRASLDDEW
ncbi:hypothetical protein JCM8208_007150 [Rhodotorula glutinis]